MIKNIFSSHKKGITLIEVLIGVFLLAIVFFGIYGIIQLAVRMSSGEQNKVAAAALANGEMERIKNLSYELVGINGGFPNGTLEATKTETVSGRDYTVETQVDYVVDSKDGIAQPQDDCPNDYKKVQVKVSWTEPFEGSIVVTTNIAPPNLVQECGESGGVLYVTVFDSFAEMIPFPLVEVKNPNTDEVIKSVTPASGEHYFALPAGVYKLVVSKNGYSTERTYGISEVATPLKPNPQVLENEVTEVSFSIDKVSSFSVSTLSPWIISDFSDSFNDQNGIQDSLNVSVGGGEVVLLQDEGDYQTPGFIESVSITPSSLIEWNEFGWQDETLSGTSIKYYVYYKSGLVWDLVPDSDLNGNSTGFDDSPIDLSGLDVGSYPQIKIRANFSTSNSQYTPTLFNWFVSWKSSGGIPIPNVTFNMRGDKTIGKDGSDDPVYKHSQDYDSGASGSANITNLEWDNYTFSIVSSGVNLESIEPDPQPVSLPPDSSVSVNLFLEAQDSLFITVKDVETNDPIFSVSVRVYNAGYDVTRYTDIKGQTYFAPLQAGNYTIETEEIQ